MKDGFNIDQVNLADSAIEICVKPWVAVSAARDTHAGCLSQHSLRKDIIHDVS
jgi:hypothetical protein